MQAYAAVMSAQNKGGTKPGVDHFNPNTIAQEFETPELRARIGGASIVPTQLIIAENDGRAKENTDHLMSTVLCENRGYQHPLSSLSDITKDIAAYLMFVSGSGPLATPSFYLVGGWIFLKSLRSPFIQDKLVAGSGIGFTKDEAADNFISFLRYHHPETKGAACLGYALRCRVVPPDELVRQYVFRFQEWYSRH